ncbi:hypothetical protein ACFLWS_03475 [Chloroflexota bacterium]
MSLVSKILEGDVLAAARLIWWRAGKALRERARLEMTRAVERAPEPFSASSASLAHLASATHQIGISVRR